MSLLGFLSGPYGAMANVAGNAVGLGNTGIGQKLGMDQGLGSFIDPTGGGAGGLTGLPYGLPGGFTGANQGTVDAARTQTLGGIQQQQNFVNALQGQNALGLQSGLASQLQQQSMGVGPNPAQAQLAQNTGNNISQQAALMNSARGANANPGLMARQASMQGGNIQQQGAGQAATLGAQQQLAAQQQLGGLANTMAGQYGGALNNLNQYSLGNQSQNLSTVLGQNQIASGIARQQMGAQQGMLGGLINAGGGALSQMGGADGGIATTMGFERPMDEMPSPGNTEDESYGLSPQSMLGKFSGGGDDAPQKKDDGGLGSLMQLIPLAAMAFASKGGKVGGQARVKGDSPNNDIVNAKLSPGEVVIPRSKVGNEDKIASFLNGLLGTNLRAG